ncbi:MAG: type II toxin-antitoxin system RelE/ParE family toxin [bacterium]|nr:type II toxin-antitoxin system RelE/ParE family toxin [bacterium]
MAEIRWTAEAERWLRDIYDYIAQDSPVSAERVVTEIYDKVQTLALFPRMGHLYDPHMDDEVRILLYGHYRIAYLVNSVVFGPNGRC